MSEPALIYNLFPPLAGTIPQWEEHLDRIAAMGFTWIFLNPINTPGLSGSLYAVKDYYGFNPRFAPESGQDPEAALAHFLKEAGRRGLKVMLDLVINHTAIDSPLITQHPEWYAKDKDGQIKHPGAIDPADATKVTAWWPSTCVWASWGLGPMRLTRSRAIFGAASLLRPRAWSPRSSFSPRPW